MAALTAEERLQRAENTASLLAKINESTGTKNTAQTMQTEYFKNAGVQVDIDSKTNKVKISTTPTSASASSPTVSNDSNTKKQDMQKQKEDRETEKFDAARYKKDQAQKAYDEYVASDEYKQRLEEQERQQKQADIVKLFLPNTAPDLITPKVIRDEKEEQLRAARDQAEAEYNASEDQKVIEHDLEAITGLSEEERRQLEAYAVGRVQDQNQTLELQGIAPTAQQEAAGLIQKYGRKRVDELAETYMRQQNAELARQVEEQARQQSNGFWGGLASSLATIPVNALGGVVGAVGQLQGAARSTGRYQTLDPNEVGTIGDTYSGAVRGQVQQNIEGEDPNFLRKAASVGYQGVMSAADSVARAYLGGGALGGAALAATGSFSQTMAEASKRGATPAQAALLATTTAGIEALSEKIPLDNLIRTAKGGTQTVMQMVKTALMQAGIEATTEEISLLGTVLADAAIMQEKSEYQLSITSKIMQGMDPAQARDMADQELIDEAVNTALVSMASGGMSSLGGSAVAQYRQNRAEAMVNPAINKPKNTQQATQAAIENNRARQERMAAEEAAQETVQPQTEAQPVQKSDGELVQDTVANLVRQKQAAEAQTEQAPVEAQEEQQTAPTQPEAQTETTQTQQQPENAAQEQPTTAQQDSTPQENTQTAPDTAIPVQNEQSAEGGQQQEQEETAPEMQRDRINAVREQAIPVTDPDGRIVSEAAGNIYTSSRTPDSFAPTIQRLVNEGQVSHDIQTNEESLRKAAESIAEDGSIQKALESIKTVAASGRTGVLDVAKGALIYDELVNSDDSTHQALAEECFVTLSQLATNTGRPMQLFSLFRKMSPDSQVKVLENEVDRNIKKMQKAGTIKKDYRASIDPQLTNMYREAAQEFQKAKGAEAKRAAEQKMQDIQSVIYAEEAAKLPTTFKAKWDAWRYMAMLGNPKTQFRNILGNSAMVPYTAAKRKIGALLEAATIRDKSKRTKSFSQDKGLLEWAKNDRDTDYINKTLKDSARLVDSKGGNPLQDDVKTFGNWELLNKLQKKIGDVTSWGDMIFKNREYAVSLAGFLKARGYTGADIQSDSVPVEVLNEARNYAVNEALRATFNDSNQLSDWFSSIGRKDDSNIFGKAANLLLEGVIPFRKTPANVLARGWEYSPMGIITTAINTGKDIHNGEYSAATAIDRLSANLTGSMLFALGYALAGGLGNMKLRGGDVDEDETRRGMQKNAIEVSIGGETYSYTIDWLAPANMPLLMGANLRESQEDPDTSSFITACMDVGLNTLEPMLELSSLSGLNDFLESVRYAEEGEELYTIISKAATSYFTQGIPSLARQATQAANEYKQTTFTTSGDKVISSAQKTIAGLGVGTPYKTDKINAWGEKENMGNLGTRIVNAFVNPGTLKKIDNSAVEQEITRLNKVQEESVTPPYISKVITYTDSNGDLHKDYRLSEEEYTKIATTQGQTAKEILEKMFETKGYQAMDDGMKATAVQMAYKYAREKAMKETLGTNYSTSWMLGLSKGTEANKILMEVADNALNSALSNINTARENNYSKENIAAYERKLDEAYTSFKGMPQAQKAKIMESATGDTKKFLEVRSKGVSTKDYLATTAKIDKLRPEPGYTTIRDIQTREAIAKMPGISDTAKDTLMKAYMTDYDPNDKSPQTTELKYDYARQELGLAPSEYTDVYRVQLDGGKKNAKIAEWMEMGYTRAEANMFYRLFAATGRTKIDVVDWYNG